MRSVRVVAHGRVQGVGYRWFVRDAAESEGVTGWVRNRRDGTVEATLHGDEVAVKSVLEELRRGPLASDVRTLDVEECADESSAEFDIRPTE
ncbi:acylphosphatase [Microbacterium sp. KUDC0406]|uniref:acylphosphatase n=1 Tax=Microbacterium sp. KUDC0406 TaxID=2909588 RepID=UPI001F321943|nr:acylphosphatase [Microbacterium sp. KUDC0406]UJP11156.1 acylphosphatase [Microbacterium sp. KUDC0406]